MKKKVNSTWSVGMENTINSAWIKKLFEKSSDITIRPIKINQNNITAHLFCVDGLVTRNCLTRRCKSIKFDSYPETAGPSVRQLTICWRAGHDAFTTEVSDYQSF